MTWCIIGPVNLTVSIRFKLARTELHRRPAVSLGNLITSTRKTDMFGGPDNYNRRSTAELLAIIDLYTLQILRRLSVFLTLPYQNILHITLAYRS